MVGAPLKPLALLTLASWMRKAHSLCKAGDKSSKDPCVWYRNRGKYFQHSLLSNSANWWGGMVWRKPRHGAGVSFCKSRWVNLMILFFVLFFSAGRIFAQIDQWHLGELSHSKRMLSGRDGGAYLLARYFYSPFYSMYHRPRPRLNKLLSHNVRQYTHTHTTAVCRCYLGCGCGFLRGSGSVH